MTYGAVASIHSASYSRPSSRDDDDALHSVTIREGTASHHMDNTVGFPNISMTLFASPAISMATTNEFRPVLRAVAPASDAKR